MQQKKRLSLKSLMSDFRDSLAIVSLSIKAFNVTYFTFLLSSG